jgi:Transposase DDE domain
MRTSIDYVSLLTIIFVLVDDWYQAEGQHLLTGKPGKKPDFSDSEVLTLMVAQDYLPYPGERQYIAYLRANYLREFPKLLDQSQFNRRARGLRCVLEQLRRHWLSVLGVHDPKQLLIDTNPLPVMTVTRSKRHSAFRGSAAKGYCAARDLKYFGYKLVLLTTLDGIPVCYDLVAANVDDRDAGEQILQEVRDCDIYGDKGFLSVTWQAAVRQQTGNRVWTCKRANQVQQNPPAFDALLKMVRERIEGTLHCLQNTGRNLERLLAKTVEGGCTRVIAKVSALVLKLVLRRCYGVDVQSFSIHPI